MLHFPEDVTYCKKLSQAKDQNRNRKFKRHHAHFVEEDEPDWKRTKEDDSDELYLL
jgi:hypothetical protein